MNEWILIRLTWIDWLFLFKDNYFQFTETHKHIFQTSVIFVIYISIAIQ